jgi:hypothetical protein
MPITAPEALMKTIMFEQPFNDEELEIIEAIEQIKREYQDRAEPLIKRLTELRNLRPPKYVILPGEEYADAVRARFPEIFKTYSSDPLNADRTSGAG